MATVGFSEAARLAGVSRQHLYRLSRAGDLKVITEILPGKEEQVKNLRKTVEVAELERVFGQLTVVDTEKQQEVTACDKSADSDYRLLEIELEATRRMLQDREHQLREARSREEWLKKQVDEAQSTLKLLDCVKAADPQEFVPIEKYRRMIEVAKGHIERFNGEVERLKNRNFYERFFNL